MVDVLSSGLADDTGLSDHIDQIVHHAHLVRPPGP